MPSHYTITGTVITGDHHGEKLGYPTANLNVHDTKEIPADGIYAGTIVRGDGTELPGAIIISSQEDHAAQKVEAYLFNFSDNLYGEELVLHIKKFLRPFKHYTDEDELKKQIARDIETIEELYE